MRASGWARRHVASFRARCGTLIVCAAALSGCIHPADASPAPPGLAAAAEDSTGVPPEPANSPSLRDTSQTEGRPIARVDVVTRNIFEPLPEGLLGTVLNVANRLHIRTRPGTIRSHLLFRPGEAWSEEAGQETARNLRALEFLEPDDIRAAPRGDSVNVTVETRDVWSTVLDFNLENVDGRSFGSFSFTERNILGLGKQLGLSYREDPTGISRSGFVQDPAVGGSRVRARFGAGSGSAGATNEFFLGVPFYAVDAPYRRVAEGRRETSVARLFQSGSEVANLDRKIENIEVTWGTNRRTGETRRRLVGTFTLLNRRLGPTQLQPGAPPDFFGGEENLRLRRFSGSLRFWRPRFIERSNVNEMGPVEDFQVGQSAAIELGFSPEFLGGTTDEGFIKAELDVGTENAAGFGTVRLSAESRVRTRLVEIIRRLDVRWVAQPARGQTVVLSALGISGTEVPRDFQIVFGGLNGLRAYSVHALAGRRVWRFNVENRLSLPGDVLNLVRVGGAGFYDAARAWGPGAAGTDWFHGAGVGLRLSFPRWAPSQVLRIDLAWPLSPTRDGRRDAVVTFGSQQAF